MAKRAGTGNLTKSAKRPLINIPFEADSESYRLHVSNLTSIEQYPDNTPWHFKVDVYDGLEMMFPRDATLSVMAFSNSSLYRPAAQRFYNDWLKSAAPNGLSPNNRLLKRTYSHTNEPLPPSLPLTETYPVHPYDAVSTDLWGNSLAHFGQLGFNFIYDLDDGDLVIRQVMYSWLPSSDPIPRIRGFPSCTHTGSETTSVVEFDQMDTYSRKCSREFFNNLIETGVPTFGKYGEYYENRTGMSRQLHSFIGAASVNVAHRGLDVGAHFESQRDKTGYETSDTLRVYDFRAVPTSDFIPENKTDMAAINRMGLPIHNFPTIWCNFTVDQTSIWNSFCFTVPLIGTRWHLPVYNYDANPPSRTTSTLWRQLPPSNAYHLDLFKHERVLNQRMSLTAGFEYGLYVGFETMLDHSPINADIKERIRTMIRDLFITSWNDAYPNNRVTTYAQLKRKANLVEIVADYETNNRVLEDVLDITQKGRENVLDHRLMVPLNVPDFFLDERDIYLRCEEVHPALWDGKWDTIIARHSIEGASHYRDEADGIGDTRDLKQHVFREAGGQMIYYYQPQYADRCYQRRLLTTNLRTLTFDFRTKYDTSTLFHPNSKTTIDLTFFASV